MKRFGLIDRISMRGRMMILIGAAMLPLAGFLGVSIGYDYDRTLTSARAEMLQAATLASARESELFATTRVLLDTIRGTPGVSVAGGSNCEMVLAKAKAANVQFLSIGVADANGVVMCHSSLRHRQAFTDPTLIQRIMAEGAPDFIVGNFMIGKVTKKPTFAVAMPMLDEFSEKEGMIFASMNLDRLLDRASAVSIGGRRSLAIVQPASARLLAHIPSIAIASGAVVADHPLIDAMRASPAGGVTEAPGLMGPTRIYGFAPVAGAETSGMMIAVGETTGFLLAPVKFHAVLLLSIGLLLFFLALAIAWWLGDLLQLRPIARLTHTAARIGAGEFDARAGLDRWQAPELRVLGRTLDRMAVRLAAGREAERAMAASEARYRLLAENTADLVTCLSAEGAYLYVSPASRDLLGYEPEELIGRAIGDISHPDDLSVIRDVLDKLRAGRPIASVQHRKRHRDGRYVWIEVNGRAVGADQFVLVWRDVSQRRRMEENLEAANRQLAELAMTDGLTNLCNRRAFDQALEDAMAGRTKEEAGPAVLMIDFDRFKRFNDRYGHLAGDDCLRRVAAELRAVMRYPGATIARYGGEEFAAVLPAATLSAALQEADALRRAIERMAIPHEGNEHARVTISVGIAATGVGGDSRTTPSDLMHRADQALYAAKANGRNRVEAWMLALEKAS